MTRAFPTRRPSDLRPGELARLAADPTLLESAVDEFLRYESPIQKIGRWTRVPVTLGGLEISADSFVVGLFGAANRHPARFADPDRLDVGRRPGHGVAFGKGIHHCLGYRQIGSAHVFTPFYTAPLVCILLLLKNKLHF